MIGIICAMQIEADAIRASLSDTEVKSISGVEFVRGKLHGKEIVVAVCGSGKGFRRYRGFLRAGTARYGHQPHRRPARADFGHQ